MKIMVNPTKLLYFEENTNSFRLGNFPETGNVIEIENDKVKLFFEKVSNPTEYNDAVEILKSILNLPTNEIQDSIDYLIDSNILIDVDEYEKLISDEKFSRQNLYFYMTSKGCVTNGIKNLKHKKILILGIGGVGSIVAEMLVRAGAENLSILDNDDVDCSNLIRQLAYVFNDIGLKKVDCLERRLKQINSDVSIEKYDRFVTQIQDVDDLIKEVDFVVCTLDKPERKIRRLINEVCVKHKKPVIFAGFAEHVAMIGPFIVPNKTACLNCFDFEHDQPINKISKVPSFGPICGMIGNMVANEIINYFVKFKRNNLQGKTMMFNFYNNKVSIKKWKKNDGCSICGGANDCKKGL